MFIIICSFCHFTIIVSKEICNRTVEFFGQLKHNFLFR